MKNPARSYHSAERLLGDTESALPAKGIEALAEYGVKIGGRVHHARMFRHVTLPAGWTGHGQQHGVWKEIRDQHGRPRATVDIHFIVTNLESLRGYFEVGTYVVTLTNYIWRLQFSEKPLVLDATWATAAAVRADLAWRIEEVECLLARLGNSDDLRKRHARLQSLYAATN